MTFTLAITILAGIAAAVLGLDAITPLRPNVSSYRSRHTSHGSAAALGGNQPLVADEMIGSEPPPQPAAGSFRRRLASRCLSPLLDCPDNT
jgi:hypothetical protein